MYLSFTQTKSKRNPFFRVPKISRVWKLTRIGLHLISCTCCCLEIWRRKAHAKGFFQKDHRERCQDGKYIASTRKIVERRLWRKSWLTSCCVKEKGFEGEIIMGSAIQGLRRPTQNEAKPWVILMGDRVFVFKFETYTHLKWLIWSFKRGTTKSKLLGLHWIGLLGHLA